MVPSCEENEARPGDSEGLGDRAVSLDWVVKEGFLEEVPLS